MLGQIVNISNNELVSEIALKCGDPFFKDFPKNVYGQSAYRAMRIIAKEYNILNRLWSYTTTESNEEFIIEPSNFNGAWRVTVTPSGGIEQEYMERSFDEVKDNTDSTVYFYCIYHSAGTNRLFYTNGNANDTIRIYYTSSIAGTADYEGVDDDGNVYDIPYLPDKYYDEILRRAVIWICQLGVATFDDRKKQKYIDLLKIYQKREDILPERNLELNRPWITIKPFKFP